MWRWLVALLLAIFGFAGGVAYGWFIGPVEYVDTTPASLREDYRTDFVLMAAERFHADHDLELAQRQLSVLGGRSPAETCAEAIHFARSASYAASDIELLESLGRGLNVFSSPPTPVKPTP